MTHIDLSHGFVKGHLQWILVALWTGICQCNESMRPVLVLNLQRYGAVSPIWDYSSDLKWVHYTGGEAQSLTDVGKRQMYNLGKLMQLDYPDLLGGALREKNVRIQSSKKARTISSAGAFMTGLIQDTRPLELDPADPRIQPKFATTKPRVRPAFPTPLPPGKNSFSVYSTNSDKDFLMEINSQNVCPNTNLKSSQIEIDALNQKFKYQAELEEVFRELNLNESTLYKKESNMFKCFSLFQYLNAEHYNDTDAKYPGTEEKTKKVFNNLKYCYEAYVWALFGEDDDLKLAASPMILNITLALRRLQAGVTSKLASTVNEEPKLILYLGHEKTLLPVLYALGLVKRECFYKRFTNGEANPDCESVEFPMYGSSIVFEVWNKTESSSLLCKVKYNGRHMKIGINQTEEDSYDCSELVEYLEGRVFKKWMELCGIEYIRTIEVKSEKWLLFLIGSNLLILVFGIIMFCYIWRDNRQTQLSEEEDDDKLKETSLLSRQ